MSNPSLSRLRISKLLHGRSLVGRSEQMFRRNMSSSKPLPESRQPSSFLYRYRHLWTVFLAINVGIGGYLLLEPKEKPLQHTEVEKTPDSTEEIINDVQVSSPSSETAFQEISDEEKRQLFKWILEEKRKVKPADKIEKKQIDEEKAILKDFIRHNEIPSF